MINLNKPGILQEVITLYDGVSQYDYDTHTEDESVEFDDYYELSQNSDTGQIIGVRIL